MAKSYARATRIADLVQRELALFIRRETNDPRLKDVSITAVKVSPDKSRARVFFTIYNTDNVKEVEKTLNKAAGYYRSLLAKSAGLRYTPSIKFEYDVSILHGAKLSQLLDDTKVDLDSDSEE